MIHYVFISPGFNLVSIWLHSGFNLASIWLQSGFNLAWRLYPPLLPGGCTSFMLIEAMTLAIPSSTLWPGGCTSDVLRPIGGVTGRAFVYSRVCPTDRVSNMYMQPAVHYAAGGSRCNMSFDMPRFNLASICLQSVFNLASVWPQIGFSLASIWLGRTAREDAE